MAMLKSAFNGQVLHLDSFKGIEPGNWKLEWKAARNRQVVLVLGLAPRDSNPPAIDLDAALASLGYFKIQAPAEAPNV